MDINSNSLSAKIRLKQFDRGGTTHRIHITSSVNNEEFDMLFDKIIHTLITTSQNLACSNL
jgi:hypothetical protein